ncbi:hypothetical protein B566_EDAN008990 [Ephemera danica]|nr:hypothetical protein B566_EDAN008990 [Ephemera danica]
MLILLIIVLVPLNIKCLLFLLYVTIQVLMNRAFSGLQLSPDSEANSSSNSDSGADSSSMLDSPLEGGFVLEEDGSEEETRKLVERRKGYIRRTSSVAFNTVRRQAFRRNSGQPQRLFHALAEIPKGTELFVFPDVESWPPTTKVDEHRSYSLVFTEQSGDRLFAFCRRVLPEGATNCIPLAYCILTSHRATGFYHKVSIVLVSLVCHDWKNKK